MVSLAIAREAASEDQQKEIEELILTRYHEAYIFPGLINQRRETRFNVYLFMTKGNQGLA